MSLKATLASLSAAAIVLAAIPASLSWAQGEASVVVSVEGPELAAPAVTGESLPPAPVEMHPVEMHVAAPVKPAVECCPIEVLRELALPSAKRAYRCYGAPIQTVLCVDNPADCLPCLFSVPVCVPACCLDTPVCVDSSVGLLGRGHVVYRWQCGFEAVITFRVHGGVLITYR